MAKAMKAMTDEQKLFFGSKAQRCAVIKKHPSWAKDKQGFRQTIKGKRNPVAAAAKSGRCQSRKRKTATPIAKRKPKIVDDFIGPVLPGGGSTSWDSVLSEVEAGNLLDMSVAGWKKFFDTLPSAGKAALEILGAGKVDAAGLEPVLNEWGGYGLPQDYGPFLP